MNITLSADERLVERGRRYAAEHGTSLNRLIRDYMQEIADLGDLERDAEEFARLAREQGGASSTGYVFDRDEAHRR